MVRYFINDLDGASEILEDNNVPFDFDGGNRIMIEEDFCREAEELFDMNDIDFEVI